MAAILLLQSASPSLAGAWTLKEGTGQAIVTGLYAEADETFDRDGAASAIPTFRKGEVSVYAEYGWTDRLTLLGQTELTAASSGEPLAMDTARFGVSALGARYRLWEGERSVVSIEATGRVAPADPDALGRLPVEAEADVRLLVGHGFEIGSFASFVDAEGAVRFGVPLEGTATGGTDEMRLDLTLGTRPRADWLILAQSFNAFETAPREIGGAERRSHKIELSVVYDVSPTLSLQLGGVATVAGADALAERGLVSAVWVRF